MPNNSLTEKIAPLFVDNEEEFKIMVGLPADEPEPATLTVVREEDMRVGRRTSHIPLYGPTRVTSSTGSFLFENLVFRGSPVGNWPIRFKLIGAQGETFSEMVVYIVVKG